VTADGVAANEALQTVTGAEPGSGELPEGEARVRHLHRLLDRREADLAHCGQERAIAQRTVACVAAVMADGWDGDGGRVNDRTRLRAVRNALAGGQP
jgi:ketosteroid isomerase-like protein